MNEQLTDWIDGSIKPVRDGVYERNFSEVDPESIRKIRLCMFRNGNWNLSGYDVEDANRQDLINYYQEIPWRGLAQDPNQDSKDAERYRWMCESDGNFRHIWQLSQYNSTKHDFDFLIDEEMAKAKK